MSYIGLATEHFEEVAHFYGHTLGFRVLESWDRPTGRGRRFDLEGLKLEVLDSKRESISIALEPPRDRIHLVVEVDDVVAAHARVQIKANEPAEVSWGAKLFQIRDPDGVVVTFLEWTNKEKSRT